MCLRLRLRSCHPEKAVQKKHVTHISDPGGRPISEIAPVLCMWLGASPSTATVEEIFTRLLNRFLHFIPHFIDAIAKRAGRSFVRSFGGCTPTRMPIPARAILNIAPFSVHQW